MFLYKNLLWATHLISFHYVSSVCTAGNISLWLWLLCCFDKDFYWRRWLRFKEAKPTEEVLLDSTQLLNIMVLFHLYFTVKCFRGNNRKVKTQYLQLFTEWLWFHASFMVTMSLNSDSFSSPLSTCFQDCHQLSYPIK